MDVLNVSQLCVCVCVCVCVCQDQIPIILYPTNIFHLTKRNPPYLTHRYFPTFWCSLNIDMSSLSTCPTLTARVFEA